MAEQLPEYANIAQIAEAILVIISFGFVWNQLREGVRLARAENARSLAEHVASFNSLLIENGELAELWYSYDKELSGADKPTLYRYREMLVQWLIFHENIYYQRKKRLLDEEIYKGWRKDLESTLRNHNLSVIGERLDELFPGRYGQHLSRLQEDSKGQLTPTSDA